MAFIQLRIRSDVRHWVNTRAITRVKPRGNGISAYSEVEIFDGTKQVYEETPDEIMAAIEKANNPLAVHVAAESNKPAFIPYAEHPEYMLNRKIGALEAERDSARRTASLARANAEKLEARNALLEAEIKAWKDAASLNLAPDDEEPSSRYETPESLSDRLRGLYRWATQAEKSATEASVEIAAQKSETERLKAEIKAKQCKGEMPLDPWRLMTTVYFLLHAYARNDAKDLQRRQIADLACKAIETFKPTPPNRIDSYPVNHF